MKTRKKNQKGSLCLTCLGLLLFLSCASTGSYKKVDEAVSRNDYSGSIELLEENKNSLYNSSRDVVLYNLDKGMLSHYAELHEDSSRLLQDAEAAIEEAYTKSVTQELGSYLFNDNTRDYPGEDYEDLYTNVFNALNYYHRGMPESAMVEIRRMNEKLRFLSTKYDLITSELQQKAIEDKVDNIPSNPDAPTGFSDSALARYLGMLFYRSSGLYDDARIDNEGIRIAFANAPAVYKYPPPSSIAGELNIPRGMARLNVISFTGLSPVKQSKVMRIPIPGGRWAKIALPEMVSRQSEVSRVEIVISNGERLNLELLEDIDAVARETFKARRNIIYLKTVMRAMVKAISSSVMGAAADEVGGEVGLALAVLSIATQVGAEVTEQADLRVSRYFPARAHVTGINLEPGRYSLSVVYYGKSGRQIAADHYTDIDVRENALNLIESYHLK
ncbi:MAG: hypothetical protein FWG99_09530 [Treponema sp.]|nr:hypothetical protein [Treponema sp.]